jgi:hypothetical protein
MTDDKDKPTYQERLKGILHSDRAAPSSPMKDHDADGAEASCAAFGYLRGIREQAESLELRFKGGTSRWFSYGLLGTWQHNPSEGLLLQFSGAVMYLVLIRGSNLDKPLNEGSINLTRGGLQRHRILWVREMTDEEIKQVGDTGPSIDSIEVAALESQDAIKDWLSKKAPTFLQ